MKASRTSFRVRTVTAPVTVGQRLSDGTDVMFQNELVTVKRPDGTKRLVMTPNEEVHRAMMENLANKQLEREQRKQRNLALTHVDIDTWADKH